ncbi:MAG: hypothetical protein NVS3B3_02510 [Aquirhabdus sp.]
MRKWQPATPAWIEAFAQVTAGRSDIEPKKMFGYPAVFLNGNMVAGLHEAGLVLRLTETDRNALLAEGGSLFQPMGKLMREYILAPDHFTTDRAALAQWLEKAIAFVATKPAKPPKEPKPRKGTAKPKSS